MTKSHPTHPVTILALLATLALTACDRPAEYDRERTVEGPVALQGYAAWLMRSERTLRLIDPDTFDQIRVPLPVTPGAIFPAPDGSGVAILDAVGVTWIAIGLDGPQPPQRYIVGARFSRVTFNPERSRLVLHHDGGATGGGLINRNQIALVDLTRPPGADNPVTRTLRAFGELPSGLVIAPESRIGGADRQLAWILSRRYLVVVDLLDPTAEEVSARLTLEGDDRLVIPVQVVPVEGPDGPSAYVRAEGTADLYRFTFAADAPADQVPRPVLNELPAGLPIDDLAVVDTPSGPRAFMVGAARSQLMILNPATSSLVGVDLDFAPTRIIPFRALRPITDDEGGEGNYALVTSGNSRSLSYIDLDRVEQRRGRAISTLTINGSVTNLRLLPGRQGAIAQLANGRTLTLLDFAQRTATPIEAATAIQQIVVDPDGGPVYVLLDTYEGEDPLSPLPPTPEVVALDPETGNPVRVPVPALGRLLVVPGAQRLLLAHSDQIGHLSAFDRGPAVGAPVETRALVFLEGMLDP